MEPVRHVYVHVPFCAHRCGYCDFVTVTGHEAVHGRYVDALLREYALLGAAGIVPAEPDTVYIGGGTPSLLGPSLLGRLLDALPASSERTVECNPESVTVELAETLAQHRVRVSLGVQSLHASTLAVLERQATPDQARQAVATLRTAGVTNLSLDVMIAVPGQSTDMLDGDLDGLVELAPEHASCYELEAKPGTRFAYRYGAALDAARDAMEDYYEHVVDRMTSAGYGWYETASFAKPGFEGVHNTAYWQGRDYAGLGVGAVSTIGMVRRRNQPRIAAYLAAVEANQPAPATTEQLTALTRRQERLILGLRLARGVSISEVDAVLDHAAARDLATAGLVAFDAGSIQLRRRGRLVANEVVSRLLRDDA